MPEENPFDPRKFHPYRPPSRTPGPDSEAAPDQAAAPPATPRTAGEFFPPSGLPQVDPAEWQEAPEPEHLAKTGADDIPLTGEEAVFTMLAVWAVMILLSALANHYAPIAGKHLWFPHVLGLAESSLIVLVLVYLFYLRHEEGFIEGLHLDFAPTAPPTSNRATQSSSASKLAAGRRWGMCPAPPPIHRPHLTN